MRTKKPIGNSKELIAFAFTPCFNEKIDKYQVSFNEEIILENKDITSRSIYFVNNNYAENDITINSGTFFSYSYVTKKEYDDSSKSTDNYILEISSKNDKKLKLALNLLLKIKTFNIIFMLVKNNNKDQLIDIYSVNKLQPVKTEKITSETKIEKLMLKNIQIIKSML